MGAISDGSFREVANYNKQRRAAYTLQNGGGVETHNPWGAALATALPSLFMTLGSKLGNMYDSEPVDDGEDSSALAESIQADIKTELKKVECTDISEVQLRLQLAQSGNFDSYPDITNKQNELKGKTEELETKNTELNSINSNLSTARSSLRDAQTSLAEYSQKLSTLMSQQISMQAKPNQFPDSAQLSIQNEIESLTNKIKKLQESINTLNSNIATLDGEKTTKEAECNSLQAEKTKLENEIKDAKTEVVKTLQQSLDNLTALKKQLKQAEGRDAIEELTNDETKSFTSELKKLQEAIKSGNQDSINKHASKLKEAYVAYKEAHPDVTNKTIEAGYKAAEKYITKK